ncbi:hypothetical protein F66182_5575 [Fusarium sp. NRRL 66182]|nr:hypothetical protein F66182_5575 [Fusarium sp. NRRL 66182]
MPAKARGCSGHGWGFIAPDVDDPPLCISLCRDRVLKELLLKDETFERVCEALQDRDRMEKEQPFRALYCCDAQACGVDNLGEGGRDPNVNWFINACQEWVALLNRIWRPDAKATTSIGYHSIIDPGPPRPHHICDSESADGPDTGCQEAKAVSTSDDGASESTPRTSSQGTITTSETATSPSTQRSISETTYSTVGEPSIAASVDPSSSTQGEQQGSKGMPLGVKVTISIIAVVGAIAIAALLFCLVRRRHPRRNDMRRLIKHPTSPPPPDSPAPLVSPTISHTDVDGVPLTPPARLRERRFLPTPADGFPSSPLFSPTSSNLSPRHERTPRICSSNQVPMIVMTAPDGAKAKGNEGSVDVVVSPPASAQIAPPGYNTDSSPPRPPRSRHASFKMLASPGPPPTRALPSTPPVRPSTPTSSPPRKSTSASS